jgi:hypothetical protein
MNERNFSLLLTLCNRRLVDDLHLNRSGLSYDMGLTKEKKYTRKRNRDRYREKIEK